MLSCTYTGHDQAPNPSLIHAPGCYTQRGGLSFIEIQNIDFFRRCKSLLRLFFSSRDVSIDDVANKLAQLHVFRVRRGLPLRLFVRSLADVRHDGFRILTRRTASHPLSLQPSGRRGG